MGDRRKIKLYSTLSEGDDREILETRYESKKCFSPAPLEQFQSNSVESFLGEGGSNLFKEEPRHIPREGLHPQLLKYFPPHEQWAKLDTNYL